MNYERGYLVKKRIITVVMAIAVVCLFASIAIASPSPSMLGMTGNILTPNDKVLEVGDFSATFQSLQFDDPVTLIGANVGITENLEVGVANYNPSTAGANSKLIINAKYSAFKETYNRPAITIGVTDATGGIDTNEDPGFYVVAGKNITKAGANVLGEPIGNLRGYLGVGTGLYKGLFIAADYSLNSKVDVVAEFISGMRMRNGLDEDAVFNAGIKMDISDDISLNLNAIDLNDFSFGISYTKAAF